MYVDRDTRGKYSIMDLREGELMLIHEALCAYVQANMGNISIYNASRIRDFDQQIKRIKDGNEKKMDFRRSCLCPNKLRKEDV
ncbi:hypothetical protein [Hoylesella shahii]|uniref:hypothetical protein n=1 Tax=Hoylesella shahii TaxID=228603 RepID=UPI00288AA029|nr:hypothetical protein [Hoylesella shahii]